MHANNLTANDLMTTALLEPTHTSTHQEITEASSLRQVCVPQPDGQWKWQLSDEQAVDPAEGKLQVLHILLLKVLCDRLIHSPAHQGRG